MNASDVVVLVLKASIFLTVLALGLRSSVDDALYLFRRPEQLVRSLLAMDVVMPLVAAMLAALFDLHPAVKVALIALAVSPVPPLLPRRQLKAGGAPSYVIGLLFAAALLAIAFAPAIIDVIAAVFRRDVDIAIVSIAKVVGLTVLAPLALGVLIHLMAPGPAERASGRVSIVGMGLLAVSIVPLLVVALPASLSLVGDGTLLAIVAFALVGLGVGHVFGGPDRESRDVLALATALRHPGVALAIGVVVFPTGQKLVMGAVLLYAMVAAVISIPYLTWSKRHPAVPGATPA